MKVGYARVSSRDQRLDRQIESLDQAGVEKIYKEKVSGKDTKRPQLQEMLKFIREGDTVVVASLDRLGRNAADLTDIIGQLRDKGALLDVLDLPSFAGVADPALQALLTNLVLEIYKYTAEQERQKIRERQRQGIELAKDRGVYKGGKRLYAPDSPDKRKAQIYREIVRGLKEGVPKAQLARRWGLGPRQVYRIKETAIEYGEIDPNKTL